MTVLYGYVWIDGYWHWNGYEWVWVGGRWEREQSENYVYIQPYYDYSGGRHVYTPGYWSTRDRAPTGWTYRERRDGRPRGYVPPRGGGGGWSGGDTPRPRTPPIGGGGGGWHDPAPGGGGGYQPPSRPPSRPTNPPGGPWHDPTNDPRPRPGGGTYQPPPPPRPPDKPPAVRGTPVNDPRPSTPTRPGGGTYQPTPRPGNGGGTTSRPPPGNGGGTYQPTPRPARRRHLPADPAQRSSDAPTTTTAQVGEPGSGPSTVARTNTRQQWCTYHAAARQRRDVPAVAATRAVATDARSHGPVRAAPSVRLAATGRDAAGFEWWRHAPGAETHALAARHRRSPRSSRSSSRLSRSGSTGDPRGPGTRARTEALAIAVVAAPNFRRRTSPRDIVPVVRAWASLVLVAACGSEPAPPVTCELHGRMFEPGDSFPAGDGCNTCHCMEDGQVGCTLIGCREGEPGPACSPAGACPLGPACGTGCCGQGERCNAGLCECGDQAACGDAAICGADEPLGADGCGTRCE